MHEDILKSSWNDVCNRLNEAQIISQGTNTMMNDKMSELTMLLNFIIEVTKILNQNDIKMIEKYVGNEEKFDSTMAQHKNEIIENFEKLEN
jgi:hypothetical protein